MIYLYVRTIGNLVKSKRIILRDVEAPSPTEVGANIVFPTNLT